MKFAPLFQVDLAHSYYHEFSQKEGPPPPQLRYTAALGF